MFTSYFSLFFMQLQLLKILSPIIMASYLVRETDFQLIVIVHENMGEEKKKKKKTLFIEDSTW